MDIVSYKGPYSTAGSSSIFPRIPVRCAGARWERWWYLFGNRLIVQQEDSARYMGTFAKAIITGHYRYCNEFLWPVMHDKPQLAVFSEGDRTSYQQFNLAIAATVELVCEKRHKPRSYFVHDYQLALMPLTLSYGSSARTLYFWHIPWPKVVLLEHVPLLAEIALGLLSTARLGFHISEYAENFLRFVDEHMPDFCVDYDMMTVSAITDSALSGRTCEVVVRPLGVDLHYWRQMAAEGNRLQKDSLLQRLTSGRYVLSIDRADYTKGILERLHAIDEFFRMNAVWRDNVTFLQLSRRSGKGLVALDRYWDACMTLVQEVNSRWRKGDWTPIIWIEEPVPSTVLARLYREAAAVAISPLRDGLNLNAKEFAACSGDTPGTLLLSRGAGVWEELGECSVIVDPDCCADLAAGIAIALSVPGAERRKRAELMRRRLAMNTLPGWWQELTADGASRVPAETPLQADLAVGALG
jgi:trehalose-6-phosphate synthase